MVVLREVKESKFEEVYSHKEHMDSVNSIAWAPYEAGIALASVGTDKAIKIAVYKGGSFFSSTPFDGFLLILGTRKHLGCSELPRFPHNVYNERVLGFNN